MKPHTSALRCSYRTFLLVWWENVPWENVSVSAAGVSCLLKNWSDPDWKLKSSRTTSRRHQLLLLCWCFTCDWREVCVANCRSSGKQRWRHTIINKLTLSLFSFLNIILKIQINQYSWLMGMWNCLQRDKSEISDLWFQTEEHSSSSSSLFFLLYSLSCIWSCDCAESFKLIWTVEPVRASLTFSSPSSPFPSYPPTTNWPLLSALQSVDPPHPIHQRPPSSVSSLSCGQIHCWDINSVYSSSTSTSSTLLRPPVLSLCLN